VKISRALKKGRSPRLHGLHRRREKAFRNFLTIKELRKYPPARDNTYDEAFLMKALTPSSRSTFRPLMMTLTLFTPNAFVAPSPTRSPYSLSLKA
jgi:hypothetical protein